MRSDFFEKFFLEERADILARGRVENVENVAEFISFFVSNDEQPRPLLLRWRITAATFSSIHFRVSLSIDTSLSLSLSLSLSTSFFLPFFLSRSVRAGPFFVMNRSITWSGFVFRQSPQRQWRRAERRYRVFLPSFSVRTDPRGAAACDSVTEFYRVLAVDIGCSYEFCICKYFHVFLVDGSID